MTMKDGLITILTDADKRIVGAFSTEDKAIKWVGEQVAEHQKLDPSTRKPLHFDFHKRTLNDPDIEHLVMRRFS